MADLEVRLARQHHVGREVDDRRGLVRDLALDDVVADPRAGREAILGCGPGHVHPPLAAFMPRGSSLISITASGGIVARSRLDCPLFGQLSLSAEVRYWLRRCTAAVKVGPCLASAPGTTHLSGRSRRTRT